MIELDRHGSYVLPWLKTQLQSGAITKYTDKRILQEMGNLYFKAALSQYTTLLKNACDSFGKDYFSEHYEELACLDYLQISQEEYIQILERLDEKIGKGKNLGEIKEYVLLQWLNTLKGEPIFYFCSDDKNARNGILSIEQAKIQCVSIISAFQWLKSNGMFTKETARPYIDSALHFYSSTKQENVKVIEASSVGRFICIPYEQVFNEIFDEKFILLPNGMLKYITNQ